MFLSAAVCLVAIAGQDKTPPDAAKPVSVAVDKSAEPALKALFASAGGQRDIHVTSEFYSRDYDSNGWDDNANADLWLGDGMRFRYYNNSFLWGGGSCYVSDGSSLMSDDLSDDGNITISAAKPTLHGATDQDVLLFLLDGQSGYDALVDTSKAITFVNGADPEKTIKFTSKKLGVIQIRYADGSPIPSNIEVMVPPWQTPDDNPYPDQPWSMETIRVVGRGAQDGKLFVVAGPKGKKITDNRAKKYDGAFPAFRLSGYRVIGMWVQNLSG